MKTRSARVLVALLVLPALFLAACASGGGTASGGPTGPMATAGPAQVGSTIGDSARGALGAPQAFAPTQIGQAPPGPAGKEQTAPLAIPVPQAFEPDRALILTANIALRADDPWAIADRVQAITTGLGGDVLALSQSGAKDQKSATLTIRVPQASFNDALRQIRAISDVEVVSSGVNGQDVTDQFVDLKARLTAKQGEEQRYLALLARADKVDDILKIDSVLAQVRTQIEQLQGQVNAIKAKTTFSTITVQISPTVPAPIPTPGPLAYDPSKTLERALTTLVSMMRSVVDVAIWGLVFSWIPLVLFGLALVLGRIRGRPLPAA